jgi:hypothetical protein
MKASCRSAPWSAANTVPGLVDNLHVVKVGHGPQLGDWQLDRARGGCGAPGPGSRCASGPLLGPLTKARAAPRIGLGRHQRVDEVLSSSRNRSRLPWASCSVRNWAVSILG